MIPERIFMWRNIFFVLAAGLLVASVPIIAVPQWTHAAETNASSRTPQPGVVPGAARALSPTEVVDRANKALRGESSRARLEMTVVTPDWSRTLGIEAWTRGRELALIAIHSPPKEKGNATLRRKGEMWLWMDRAERVIKIAPAMMHSSWQGSDFTYEDIVKADSIVRDYSHSVLERRREEGFEVLKIEARPMPEAPVVWGKVFLWCRLYPDGWVVAVREEDYNERGELIRTIELSEVEMAGGRLIPMRLECRPARRPGRKTVIRHRAIEFDLDLPDGFFSLDRLQRPGG